MSSGDEDGHRLFVNIKVWSGGEVPVVPHHLTWFW